MINNYGGTGTGYDYCDGTDGSTTVSLTGGYVYVEHIPERCTDVKDRKKKTIIREVDEYHFINIWRSYLESNGLLKKLSIPGFIRRWSFRCKSTFT